MDDFGNDSEARSSEPEESEEEIEETEEERTERLEGEMRELSGPESDGRFTDPQYNDFLQWHEDLTYDYDWMSKLVRQGLDYLERQGSPLTLAFKAVRSEQGEEAAKQRHDKYLAAFNEMKKRHSQEELRARGKAVSAMYKKPAQLREAGSSQDAETFHNDTERRQPPPLPSPLSQEIENTEELDEQKASQVDQAQRDTKAPSEKLSALSLSGPQRAILGRKIMEAEHRAILQPEYFLKELREVHQREKEQLLREHFPEFEEIKKTAEKHKQSVYDFMALLQPIIERLNKLEPLLAKNHVPKTHTNYNLPKPDKVEQRWNPIFKAANASVDVKRKHESSDEETQKPYDEINDFNSYTSDEKHAVKNTWENPGPREPRWPGSSPRFPTREILDRVTVKIIHKTIQDREGRLPKVVSAVFQKFEPEQGVYGATFFKLLGKQMNDDTRAQLLQLNVGQQITFTPQSLSSSIKRARTGSPSR